MADDKKGREPAEVNGLTEPQRESAARLGSKLRALKKVTAKNILEIGRTLIEAKAVVGHGHWREWLQREVAWSERSARNFMAVAERFKSATVADLDIDAAALYLLAGSAVPEQVRNEAVARAEAGERITLAIARSAARTVSYQKIEAPPPVSRPVEYERGKVEARAPYTVSYTRPEAEDPAQTRLRLALNEVSRGASAIAAAVASGAVLGDAERDRLRQADAHINEALDATANVIPFPGKD